MQLDVLLLLGLVDVNVDDVAPSRLHLPLVTCGGLGDLAHLKAVLDRFHHPAEILDLAEVLVGLPLELVGQRLDEVGAA